MLSCASEVGRWNKYVFSEGRLEMLLMRALIVIVFLTLGWFFLKLH